MSLVALSMLLSFFFIGGGGGWRDPDPNTFLTHSICSVVLLGYLEKWTVYFLTLVSWDR
jgi:hypothetical protein